MIYSLFAENGIHKNRIFYNSLSTPFFISNRLDSAENSDVLFWQEPVGQTIPGNMQMILNNAERTRKVMVQKRSAYEMPLKLGVDKKIMKRLGFISSRKNRYKLEAIIYGDA